MTNTVDTNSYQTYLKNCDCPNGGIIIYQGKAVCRWCRKPYSEGSKMNYLPEHFQQSIPNKQDERIEVQHIAFTYDSDRVVKFQLSKPSTEEQLLLIKKAIEAVLNQPSTTPIEDKGWEILTWFSREGEVALLVCGEIEGNLYAGYKIRSVRRTSDNEVFTVGDDICEGVIKSFKIDYEIYKGMVVCIQNSNFKYSITNITKLPSMAQDKGNVLFTTNLVKIDWEGIARQAINYKTVS